MSGPAEKKLSMEDRVLWGKVARSVTPLAGKTVEEEAQKAEEFAALLEEKSGGGVAQRADPPQPARPKTDAPHQHGFDRPTRQKLAKGRLPIEGKVDLHGLTQSEAHALLLSFLHRAHAEGRRHVLVVTGKGSSLGSDGVLRRAVPAWFSTPPFRALVGAHEPAARHHGGTGALYVRLRRQGGSS